MKAMIDRRSRCALLVCLTLVLGIGMTVDPAHAQTYPAPWIGDTSMCPVGGPYTDCWVPIPRFSIAGVDQIAASDASHNSNPQPRGADIFNGELADQTSIWFAYDSTNDVVMFRKRLDGTPTLAVGGGSNPPGTDASGPFKSNTAWNFILDFNGDGWADIAAATDGNTGKTQDPGDTIQLGWGDTPGDQEVLIFGNGGKFDPAKDFCSNAPPNQGRILFYRKANEVPPLPGCPTQQSTVCDFSYTRVLNDCPTNSPLGCETDDANFDLEMQFPRSAFDDCLGPNDDGDGVGGRQKLELDSHFMLCVTTSTQPNDFTGKDLSLDGAYDMRKTRQLVCSDPCTLTAGCSEDPVILELQTACGAGTNKSPITLTALVMDTLIAPTTTTVSDSIQDVAFDYSTDNGLTYTPAVSLSGAPNPVTSPDVLPNTWTFDWDTSGLSAGVYLVRVRVTDDQGHVTDGYYEVDTNDPACSATATPVTLADFSAQNVAGRTRFAWTTATETGTVGFNLYAVEDGVRHKLNSEPIPSRVIDSLTPQSYSFDLPVVRADAFELEDVDVRGTARRHGVFQEGRTYGRPVDTVAVDWGAVRSEHNANAARRSSRRARGGDRGASAAGATAAFAGRPARTFPAIDLAVDADGVYRVTYEDLAKAGFDLAGVSLNRVAVVTGGRPVARRAVAPGMGRPEFGPGAYLEFVGTAAQSLYTKTRVYRLLDDPSLAEKMQEDQQRPGKGTPPTSYMATATVERELAYSQMTPSDDPWYETYILAYTSPREKSFTIDVEDLVDGAAPSRLEVALWGMTSWPQEPDHHVVVELNGQRVADQRFDGLSDHPISAGLPVRALQNGANTITVRLPGDTGVPWDLAYVDSYAITYPRAPLARSGWLDFTSGAEVLEVGALPEAAAEVFKITGDDVTYMARVEMDGDREGYRARFAGDRRAARYLVVTPGRMLTPAIAAAPAPVEILGGEADYLVVAHPDFLGGVGPLVELHESEGMSVKVVDVTDVYDTYSGGTVDPEAIRDYIRDAARTMGTRFVLLVGGDTYDYFDYLGSGSISFIPTLYARTGDLVSFAPADPLFGDVDGDGVQDIAVGRLPVRTGGELANVVAKTLEYAGNRYPKTAVFAADVSDRGAPVDFTTSSEAFIAELGAGWDVDRAYIQSIGVTEARTRLVNAINSGASLTSFIGHSGLTVWTFSGLFNSRDIAGLANGGRPTVVTQWGCWNTYHVEPAYDGLGQRFLLETDRGAAAVLGSSTWTLAGSEDALGRLMTPLLGEPGTPIGAAVIQAKRQLAESRPDLIDVQLGWTLLGDPALVVTPW